VPKILTKSGESLADMYDVEGSIAGVENLISEDVNLVHEMGAEIHSERLGGVIVNLPSANGQSESWAVTTTLGDNISRILGIQVLTDTASRLQRVQVSITDDQGTPAANTDLPLMCWDTVAGLAEFEIDIHIDGSNMNLFMLQNLTPGLMPSLMIGRDQRAPVRTISMRGKTLAFGAGTVTTRAVVYVAFPGLGGVSSKGLPTPSW